MGTTYRKQAITEKYQLNTLEVLVQQEISRVEDEQITPKPKKKTNITKLMEKFCKLTIAYIAEVLTDDEYLTETAVLKKVIEEAKQKENPKERDLTPPKELLEVDYRSIYETLTPEERRRFWRCIMEST